LGCKQGIAGTVSDKDERSKDIWASKWLEEENLGKGVVVTMERVRKTRTHFMRTNNHNFPIIVQREPNISKQSIRNKGMDSHTVIPINRFVVSIKELPYFWVVR
jgi:hypothetical protein